MQEDQYLHNVRFWKFKNGKYWLILHLVQKVVIPALPLLAQEMCKYEQIREDIINERNEAMAQCKFFEDLLEAKNEMTQKKAVNKEGIAAKNTKKKQK